jgi:hypothetical protein
MMRLQSIRTSLSLMTLACAVGCGGSTASGPRPESGLPTAATGCDLASRDFQQTSPGPCASSTWHFSPRGDGTYDAKETGCANATGTAHYDGSTLVLDFKYADGAGQYSWPLASQCQPATGTVQWSAGPLRGQSVQSTLAPSHP